MQAIETLIPTDATTCTTDTERSSPETLVLDQPTAEVDTLDSASGELLNSGSPSEKCADTDEEVDADLTTIRTDESTVADPLLAGGADETVLETQDDGEPTGHVIDDGFR